MHVLHLLPDFDYRGSTKESWQLAQHLRGPGCHIDVVALGSAGPYLPRFHECGIDALALDWNRVFDPTPLWKLRLHLKNAVPDRIHVWGLKALRSLGLVGRKYFSRVHLSTPVSATATRVSPLDRWLIGQVQCIVARGPAEADRYARLGLPNDKITVVPPGVEVCGEPTASTEARRLVCLGPMTQGKGFRNAIWTADVLRFVFEDIDLVLAGNGPERTALEQFAQALELSRAPRFVGPVPESTSLWADATVAWVPTLHEGSTHVTLEAMAAGRPIIASQVANLADIVSTDKAGILVPPDDKALLARHTRTLLLDADLRASMGRAAREHVRQHFSIDRYVTGWQNLYRDQHRGAA